MYAQFVLIVFDRVGLCGRPLRQVAVREAFQTIVVKERESAVASNHLGMITWPYTLLLTALLALYSTCGKIREKKKLLEAMHHASVGRRLKGGLQSESVFSPK